MYHSRPPSKPWRVARNYAAFFPDKMQSERHGWQFRKYGRHAEWTELYKRGNDMIMRREQRRQQRRFNRWLCNPQCPEWGE